MSEQQQPDWDPRSEAVLKDQRAAYDTTRRSCPVARSKHGYTSLLKHEDVLRALLDHDTYSNAVSRYPSVPNGMDPPEHTPFRQLIEPYFNARRMREFEPVCRSEARSLVAALPEGQSEWMSQFAQVFALRIQCAFMGWPHSLHEPLHEWTQKNRAATLAADPHAMARVAEEFDGHVKTLLAHCRRDVDGSADDVTSRLLRERVNGRPLTEDEIVSIIRNWTVGELGTLAASVGILAHYLAEHPDVQALLRAEPGLLPAAIDEILRIHGPLVMNRRRVTRPVQVRGRSLKAGERVALNWISANRDEDVFGDPDEFRLDRDPSLNLLYGAGVHVCPGAPLARLELRVVMEELLSGTQHIGLAADAIVIKAHYPASGFSSLPLAIQKPVPHPDA